MRDSVFTINIHFNLHDSGLLVCSHAHEIDRETVKNEIPQSVVEFVYI